MDGGNARERAEQAARLLAADPRVRLVYLFGSAAQAERREVRDVDLGVLTDPALPLDELMKLRADLAGGIPLDLVSLNDASIALAHEIVESGICLFARTPDVQTEFVTRARARYWDFKPYREEQWRLAGERLEERRLGS
jgi:predicted nucleotidyltransferase